MTPFHIHLHGPGGGPIGGRFEAAAERLQKMDRLVFEPDGSFAWADRASGAEVTGIVYDAAGRIQYVELRGRLPMGSWRAIVAAIDPAMRPDAVVVVLPGGGRKNLQEFERSSIERLAGEDGAGD